MIDPYDFAAINQVAFNYIGYSLLMNLMMFEIIKGWYGIR